LVGEEGAGDQTHQPVTGSSSHPQRAETLRFESDLEVRLLWVYPDDWRRLTTAQLESLCRRANTVIARFRRGEASPTAPRAPDPREQGTVSAGEPAGGGGDSGNGPTADDARCSGPDSEGSHDDCAECGSLRGRR
jgi:hypothetical protein